MNIKTILTSIVMLLLFQNVDAQRNRQAVREKVESQKVAFITQKLNLTTEEAQSFWPIYNELKNEMSALRETRKDSLKDMSEADAKLRIQSMFDMEEKNLDIKRKYADKMEAVIGARRTFRFLRLDREFRERMIREVKERKRTRRGN